MEDQFLEDLAGLGAILSTSPPVSFSMVRPGVARCPSAPATTEIAATLPAVSMDLSPGWIETRVILAGKAKVSSPLQPPSRGARPVHVGPSLPTLPPKATVI